MSRKQYESYHYDDPDFEYTYPNEGTLRNKLEIHDQRLALEKEYRLSAERVLELGIKPITVRSMKDSHPPLHLSGYVHLGGRVPQGQYLKVRQGVHGEGSL